MFESGLIAVVVGLATVFGIAYLYFTSRHRERMALIERGLPPAMPPIQSPLDQSLKYGLVGLGLGIGLIMGAFLARYTWLAAEVAYLAASLIGGAVGLLAFYFSVRPSADQ